jgi:aldehyde dehydrogenase (NAD+)
MPSSAAQLGVREADVLSSITGAHNAQKQFFSTGDTRLLPWRKRQLTSLINLLKENYDTLSEALSSDLGKSLFEGQVTEIEIVLGECVEAIAKLDKWVAPVSVGSPGVLVPSACWIRNEPRGVVLIIAPFNYPLFLSLGPLVSALAGGNVAVLKPSELCPATSAALARLVPKYFAPTVVAVVEGAIMETTALMKLPWDLVFFTGSARVGSIVAEAAAKTLTPCVLELGGKSPLIVTENAPHMRTMCNRILWGKTVNAGQTCVAPDYVLCHRSVVEPFLAGLKAAEKDMFGDDIKGGKIFSRNVSETHTQRLIDMVKQCEADKNCKIVLGGSKDASAKEKYLAPTVVLMDKPQDVDILKHEIFGAILPVIPYDDEAWAVAYVNSQPGTPLAFYCFTESAAQYDRLLDRIPSGGTIRNDVLLHGAVSSLPFGGVGTSGYGSAHGIHGFQAFTHKRSVMYKPCHPIWEFGDMRYPPYNKYGGMSGKLFKALMRVLPELPPLDGLLTIVRYLFALMAIFVALVAVFVGLERGGGAVQFGLAKDAAHFVGDKVGAVADWLKQL